MDINELIEIVKKKIQSKISVEKISVEDKSFLHKKHKNNSVNKFHLKISIKSKFLKNKKKIESSRQIYKLLEKELKEHIHSVQLNIE
tara:strand:+ start:1969 stop:2229 length:261 start_codon:yes stop_codon:yes gene_type:complete